MELTIKNAPLEEKILSEQVKILFDSMPSLLLINLLVSSCLSISFWGLVADPSIIIWMGLMLVMLALRAAIFYSYKQHYRQENLSHYSTFLVVGSLVAGIIWGAGGVLLFPAEQVDYQLFLLLSFLAMTGGSIFTLSIYLPCFYAYVPLTLLPITCYLFLGDDSIHITLGSVSLVFLAALTSFNSKMNKSFKLSLRLRYENIDLIEELKLQKNEADRANNAKSKFLAAASHDLRQPLYALGLFTSALKEISEHEKTRKIADQIDASVDSLQNLFDKLLDISQLDAGVIEVEKKSFLLQPIFDKLSNEFHTQAEEKNLSTLWPNVSFVVNSDPRLLEQILRNLVSNAIRHTLIGGITIKCAAIEKILTVDVIDTGIGISEAQRGLIFQEFYQVGNSERDRSKGLGLGLSIVERTAKLLKHVISVESQFGRGSRFSISLPLVDIILESEIEAPPAIINFNTQRNHFIVVIDNEKNIREGLCTLMNLWGYDVLTASSCAQALKQLEIQKRIPEAIISDFCLENNLSGIQAIQSLHNTYHSDIPALIITGDIEVARLTEINASKYQVLYKPVPPVKLRAFLLSIKQV
jgi:signal transduction histidine kinase/CheY-like chemotaxis protein